MPPTEGLTDGKAAIPLYQQVIDIIKKRNQLRCLQGGRADTQRIRIG